MKYFVSILLSGFTLAFGFSNCQVGHDDVQFVNKPQLQELLKNSKGKYVILNYWATWCKSCKTELKLLAKLQKTYSKENLRVICISIDPPDDKEKVKLAQSIYADSGDFYASFISNEKSVKDIMTVVDDKWMDMVPLTYLVDKEGKLSNTFMGKRDLIHLERKLARLLESN